MKANFLGEFTTYELLGKVSDIMTKCDIAWDTEKKKLFICCPGCGIPSFTGTHNIVRINDSFTVTPSIQMHCIDKWHGYLEDNKFRTA